MAEEQSALVVFVDVRGFTKWSEVNEVFINLGYFVSGFMSILRKRFPDFQLRPRVPGRQGLGRAQPQQMRPTL